MIPLVEFPLVVEHYAPFFKDVFSAEAWIEFKRYISGLIVSENKTVEGINRLLVVESRNQSTLNRLLTESRYGLAKLNDARLAMLDSVAGTQRKPKGVLSIDDTLLSHYGKAFEQIAKLYDPVEEHYVWAHDLVTLHYSDDQTDYPLLFRLWKPVDIVKLEQGMRAAGRQRSLEGECAGQMAQLPAAGLAPTDKTASGIGATVRQQAEHRQSVARRVGGGPSSRAASGDLR